MKQFRDIYFHGFSLCFFDNPFEMNIEKLEAKVEAVESQLGEVVLLLKKPLSEWTVEEEEEYGDKTNLRDERRGKTPSAWTTSRYYPFLIK